MASISLRRTLVFAAFLVTVQAFTLFTFGQPPICTCGYVKAWEGVVLSSGNSQHLTDWYTFSHIIHGILLYVLLWWLFPRMSIQWRFLLALGLEAGWEIFENTPWLINHYRQQALSQGYVGDSIINSVSDSIAMIIGFWAAWRFPVWAIVALGLGLELWVGYEIRDNFTLNTINLIHVFPSISQWQAGPPS